MNTQSSVFDPQCTALQVALLCAALATLWGGLAGVAPSARCAARSGLVGRRAGADAGQRPYPAGHRAPGGGCHRWPGHWVGGVRSDATGLPVFGWSTTGGDLRVPHFFAAHLLQALPLTAWLAKRAGLPRPRRWVTGALLLGGAVVFATFVQALRARPFWPL